MSFCKSILKKDIYDLNLEDLQSYFSTEQEETSIIEFKSGQATLENIYKEVAAFLNTEGGILIIGSPKEITSTSSSGRNIKKCLGNLTPSLISNQDVLMRGIASNIAPSPSFIKVKALEIEGGYVYVLEIPQSLTPPHQVSDEGRYYIRLDREAKAAPHGIVEALFQKRQNPLLEVEFHIQRKVAHPNSHFLLFKISNKSLISAESFGYLLEIDGVKTIKNQVNISSDYKLNDGHYIVSGVLHNQIIVKGIQIPLEIEAEFLHNNIFVTFSYYCKGCQMETLSSIFDNSDFKFISEYNSRKLENEKSHEAIISEYDELDSKRIRDLFSNSKFSDLSLSEMVSEEAIKKLISSIGQNLPPSYVNFLQYSNGCNFLINDTAVKFYNIEAVLKLEFGFNISRSFLIIGKWSDSDIYLRFKDDKWDFALRDPINNRYSTIGVTFNEVIEFMANP